MHRLVLTCEGEQLVELCPSNHEDESVLPAWATVLITAINRFVSAADRHHDEFMRAAHDAISADST